MAVALGDDRVHRRPARTARDRPELHFETLIDVCGVDYSAYGGEALDVADYPSTATPAEGPAPAEHGARFAVVYHLLSLANNWRLRVRAYALDDAFPVVRLPPEPASRNASAVLP